MKITVEYAAQLKRAAGLAKETIVLPEDTTLQALAESVADRHGDAVRAILLADDGAIHPSILVFQGENQIRGGETTLTDGAVISFLSPISGG